MAGVWFFFFRQITQYMFLVSSSFPADPYVIIKCEGEKVTTSTCKDTTNPEWNTSAIFYRTQPHKKPVKIQVEAPSSLFFQLSFFCYLFCIVCSIPILCPLFRLLLLIPISFIFLAVSSLIYSQIYFCS